METTEEQITSIKKDILELKKELISKKARKRESTNFLIAILVGVFIGLLATIVIDIFHDEVSFRTNNIPSEEYQLHQWIFYPLGLIISIVILFLYKYYKKINEVVDFEKFELPYKNKIKSVYKLGELIKEKLEKTELSRDRTVRIYDEYFKEEEKYLISIQKTDLIVWQKNLIKLQLINDKIVIEYSTHPETDYYKNITGRELQELMREDKLEFSLEKIRQFKQ